MTMPTERYNSLKKTEKFLNELLDDALYRDRAYTCLRHFPWTSHLEELAEACPHILENPDEG